MSKELTTKPSFDMTAYEGKTGFEDFGANDISMAWLRIAAKNTDAANEDSADHIEDLKPGMFFVPSQKRVFGKSVRLIALKYFRTFSEVTPGDSKYVRTVSKREVDALTRVGAAFPLPNGNIVKEAFNYLVICPDATDAGIMRFSVGAGAFKHVKNWNAMMLAAKAPMWAVVWELQTSLSTSQDGKNTYYSLGDKNTLISKVGFIEPEIKDDVLAAFEQAQGFDSDVAEKDDAPF